MRNGGAGTISATAKVNPAAINALYQSAKSQAPNSKHQGNLTSADTADVGVEKQQSKLNAVREVFSSRKFPSMIAALKQALAIYANDPEWARVRAPLVELTEEQAKLLAEQLKEIGFAMNGIRRN
jgi:4-hydroxy-tetrahydrodipicolinate synthase